MALLALALIVVVTLSQIQGSWLPYLILPIFILDGVLMPAQMLAGSNFLVELVPEAERPLYLGLGNTMLGVIIVFSGLGGLVVDVLGFAGLFILTLGLYLLAFGWSRALPEPRVKAAG
jgi:hypothetical protein